MYKALLIGQLGFLAIVIFLFAKATLIPSIDERSGNIFMYVAIAISILSVGISYKIFNQKLQEAKQQTDLNSKLNGYRAALITQLAMSEGPALFVIICYFLIGNKALLIVLLFLLLNFARLYPTKQKVIQQLELDSNDESSLE